MLIALCIQYKASYLSNKTLNSSKKKKPSIKVLGINVQTGVHFELIKMQFKPGFEKDQNLKVQDESTPEDFTRSGGKGSESTT